ncbi:hypothetical protein SAMN05216483_0777 [Streptomyces sp. 2131.1]|nr:hypothetical protein SAMN05216483_0777 [Streptomyces sp. 2131.1]
MFNAPRTMCGMNRQSKGAERVRGTGAAVVLAWVFVLVSLVACCSPQSVRAHTPPDFAPSSALATLTDLTVVRVVVADSPRDRGVGDSCHGTSGHSAPAVPSARPGPAAVPSAAVVLLPARPATCGPSIRGPSNDAVDDTDPVRLQVQRT